MDSPGAFTLGDFTVGAPVTWVADPQAGPLTGLDGISAASLQVRLSGGAGGTKINVYVQTSLDQGQSWFDIANVAFANTPGVEILNLTSAPLGLTEPSNMSLADNAVLNGALGDRLQAVVVSTGTYTGSTLVSVRGCARDSMADASAVAAYQSALARVGQSVTFIRVNGRAPNTATFSATVNAVVGDYLPDTEAVRRTEFSESKLGAITQGDRRVIVSAADLANERFPLPVRKNDKIVIAGEQLNVTDVDANKRSFAGAIELTVTGV